MIQATMREWMTMLKVAKDLSIEVFPLPLPDCYRTNDRQYGLQYMSGTPKNDFRCSCPSGKQERLCPHVAAVVRYRAEGIVREQEKGVKP